MTNESLISAIEAIPAIPEPILLVVKVDRPLTKVQRQLIRESVEALFNGKPPCPIAVVEPGMSIEAVVDPRYTG